MSDSILFQTPPIAPQSTVPPPPPSASRPPLESAKRVLSAELFQRRHALEYAHLHSDADSWELKAEESILAEERRIGRMRRERLSKDENGQVKKGRALSVDGAGGNKPLSLVTKQEKGHARSLTEVGLGIDVLNRSPPQATKRRSRPNSFSGGLRPLSLRSSLVTPGVQSRPLRMSDGHGLEVLIERESSSSPDRDSSEGDKSIATSTYSWATSFSGETTDLRTAAHYVPSRAVTPEHETALDSPARKDQRRKRIVAIAHTVRQLEGVGSRDLEDPTFYTTLAKAWYERFDKAPPPQTILQSPAALPPTPAAQAPPFVPDSESSNMALRRFNLPAGGDPTGQSSSPPDPEFKTPAQGFEFSSINQDYPRPKSLATSVASRSVRYSYASTLHDLGVEGILQGSKLMNNKAWMRPKSATGTPWGGDFDAPPGLRIPSMEDSEMNETSWTSSLDSPFEFDHQMPARRLRRVDGVVERPIKQRVVSDEKEPLDSPKKLPAEGEAGPSICGTGFVNAWWDSTPNTAQPTPIYEYNRGQEGFPFGEDGIIPLSSSPLSSQNKRKTTSTSSAILEPECETQADHQTLETISISPSDQMFLETLFPVPSRRRSLTMNRSMRRSLPARLRLTRNRSRRASDPGSDPRIRARESVFSSLYLANSNQIRSITSSRPDANLPQQLPTEKNSSLQVHVEDQSIEDGSIGLENLSLRSISPLPTPPLDNSQPPSLMTRRQKYVPPIITSLFPSQSIERQDIIQDKVLLSPPVRVQSMQRFSTLGSDSQNSPVFPFPTPSISGRTVLTDIPLEVEQEMEQMLEGVSSGTVSIPPRLPTPVRLNSQHHHISLWSSQVVSPQGTVSPVTEAGARGIVRPERPLAVTRFSSPAIRGPVNQRPRPLTVNARVALAALNTRPERTATKTLFWFGFICPLLWLIGAWMKTKPSSTDTEKNTLYGYQPRIEEMSWYRRWTYDADPWIERCRWAAGITVPLAIIGGVIAGILVATL